MLLRVADKEKERDTTVNAKRRKDWTAKQCGWAQGCQESHLFRVSPLLIAVLLLSTPNSHTWQLEKVRGRNWGNRWHIQMWLSHRGVAEQLEEGEPATWLMPGSGEEGQRPILWAAHAVILGLATSMTQHVSCTTWHWCVTSKHHPGTGKGGWGEVGVSGSCFGSSVWTGISGEAASPTLGALQRFLKVTLPSAAVT